MKTLKSLIFLTLLLIFTKAEAQDAAATSAINNVYTAYLGVKNALATDDNPAAKSKASALFAAIQAVPSNKLTPKQLQIWTAYTDKLQFDSRHISESSALDHQREHFTSLSKNLYEVLRGLKLNTSVIYEEYCPMKKAYWLSETATIKNPYLGTKMSTCGKVTATLNPAR